VQVSLHRPFSASDTGSTDDERSGNLTADGRLGGFPVHSDLSGESPERVRRAVLSALRSVLMPSEMLPAGPRLKSQVQNADQRAC
jgi:hypothetical protein